jgi:AcrR family transcriptional regulator
MPKQVDHDQRREELAAAVWRLIMREGVEAASIRRVADEAGWSTGSLRHYFATQSDLLSFAMELVTRRVTERLETLPRTGTPQQRALAVLSQVLPLDPERHAEMQVWLAFTTRAFVDPALRPRRDQAHAMLRRLCRQITVALGARAPALAAERLHALVDGLALHAVLAPGTTTPDRQREILAVHLQELPRR